MHTDWAGMADSSQLPESKTFKLTVSKAMFYLFIDTAKLSRIKITI